MDTQTPVVQDHNPDIPIPEEEKIKENIEGRKQAEEVLELIKDETNPRFWETLRNMAIERIGLPPKAEEIDVKVFTDEEAREFEKQVYPRGKYADMTVKAVEKKDPGFANRFAYRLDRFQLNLQRYLKWIASKPKKKSKKSA